MRMIYTYEMNLLIKPIGNSEKSEPQMGFERDDGWSWVRIPSGARIFPSCQWVLLTFHFICVYHSHIRSLGWLVGRISYIL